MADRITIKQEELDLVEQVMRAQLSDFNSSVDLIKKAVHTDLQECSGTLYVALQETYDTQLQVIMDSAAESVQNYINTLVEADNELAQTTDHVENILRS